MFQGTTWWGQEEISWKVKHSVETGKSHSAPERADWGKFTCTFVVLPTTALGRPDWLMGGVTWHKCINWMFYGSLFCHPFLKIDGGSILMPQQWAQTGEVVHAVADSLGNPQPGEMKTKCHRENPSLVKTVCGGTHVMCAGSQAPCRLVLWKLKFFLIFLSLHCVVAVWPCCFWEP